MSRDITQVGVYHIENRNWHRNITCHNHEEFEFRIYHDYCRVANAILRRMGTPIKMYKFLRRPPSWPRVDLFHHFRMLDAGTTPWVVSTSSGLPFGWPPDRRRHALDLLASDLCKQIIVTGQCALDWQSKKLDRAPDLKDVILSKMRILPPVQPLLVNDPVREQSVSISPLRLVFVGGHFVRKGGLELVRVVDKLSRAGANVHLDVVSNMELSVVTNDTQSDLNEARQIITESDAITPHGRLSNEAVLDLFRNAHIGCLPSYVETYGYTVLEAQASGCATITTDVFAFPETNPDSVGWRARIDGPDYDFKSNDGRRLISERLESELERILESALNYPDQVARKGAAALDRIAADHDPARHGKRLRAIYRDALDQMNYMRREDLNVPVDHRIENHVLVLRAKFTTPARIISAPIKPMPLYLIADAQNGGTTSFHCSTIKLREQVYLTQVASEGQYTTAGVVISRRSDVSDSHPWRRAIVRLSSDIEYDSLGYSERL